MLIFIRLNVHEDHVKRHLKKAISSSLLHINNNNYYYNNWAVLREREGRGRYNRVSRRNSEENLSPVGQPVVDHDGLIYVIL